MSSCVCALRNVRCLGPGGRDGAHQACGDDRVPQRKARDEYRTETLMKTEELF